MSGYPPGVTQSDVDQAAPAAPAITSDDICMCEHPAVRHASFTGRCMVARCPCTGFEHMDERIAQAHAGDNPPDEVPEVEATPVGTEGNMLQRVNTESTETAVAPRETGAVSPFDLDPATFRAAVQRRTENVKTLLETLNSILKPGEHYGKIHLKSKNECQKGNQCDNPYHWSKNVLFKPGAEKINQFLGLTPRYRPLSEEERRDYGIVAEDQIVVKCELLSGSGAVCSEGLGARTLDVRDGPHALNKALKMAEKSARINATIQLGLSDCYTQDLDDMVETIHDRGNAKAPAKAAPPPDMSPELERSIHEATVKRLTTLKQYAGDKMTEEDYEKLAKAQKWLAEHPEPKAGEETASQSRPAESPAPPAAGAERSGSAAAPADRPKAETVPDIMCECGSTVERRTSQKGAPFLACALQYAAKWGPRNRREDAIRMLALVEEQRPELIGNHYYKSLNGARKR